MKKIGIILFFILLVSPGLILAQPGMPNNPTPVDGGLLLLAAAGAGLGLSKKRK